MSQLIAKRSNYIRVFEDSLSVSNINGNVTKQQQLEIARREQEIRAMNAQNEARRQENEARRLEIEAKRLEIEAKHMERMQDLFHD